MIRFQSRAPSTIDSTIVHSAAGATTILAITEKITVIASSLFKQRKTLCKTALILPLLTTLAAQAQTTPLDPTRTISYSSTPHTKLTEQYIWTAGDVTSQRPDRDKFPWNRTDLRAEPHFFKTSFTISTLPKAATLYIAGPREAHVFLNGHLLGNFFSNTDEPINFRVFHADATKLLRTGKNTLAIEAIRGKGVVTVAGPKATEQMAYGEVLAAKIVPVTFGIVAPPLVISNDQWSSTLKASANWYNSSDTNWQPVQSLGPIESNIDFLQWSIDAGMYEWPGYMGMSDHLRTYPILPSAITHTFTGSARFQNIEALTTPSAKAPFTVTNINQTTENESPTLLLDFGREISGRLFIESASPTNAKLSIAYGESEIEALATGISSGQQGGNYLGTNTLEVPANGTARGPKSAFRYIRIRFLGPAAFKTVRAEGIYYPVEYKGSFSSSDPLLNKIWETGAYTVHLCMQDGIWDAPKRDRGRWVGDLDVEGRTINTAFGDPRLIEETLSALVPAKGEDVNGIPGYSALWITSLLNLYLHTNDKAFLTSQHNALLQILATMDSSLDAQGKFINPRNKWLFVDWAPDLYASSPAALAGTQLQYVRAYNAAATLLNAIGDTENAQRYTAQSAKVLSIAHTFRDTNNVTYGRPWQLNALGVLADPSSTSRKEWQEIFTHIKQDSPTDPAITPYFNSYLLDAMSATGSRRQALDWIRTYWGGMLAEGATSFWEAYDLRWPKSNPHLSLQADGTSGYFVSFAHGWSSGPTAWLSENILGITPTAPGYDHVSIHPDLLGLDFAQGAVPTPHGPISIRIDKTSGITLDLPQGIEATVDYTGHKTVINKSGRSIIPYQ